MKNFHGLALSILLLAATQNLFPINEEIFIK